MLEGVGPMSKQRRNLNAVFGWLRRPMLVAELSTATVGRSNIGNASPPQRLPVGEYVPGGRVDAMRRLLRGR